MNKPEIHCFRNGMRMVHKRVLNSKIAHIGILVGVGSRDEAEDELGLAHFWEHMVFKGTKKRNKYQVINRLENLGGEINAFTTKEYICFYASVLDIYLNKAVELLFDITFHSVFPAKEIEKEKNVILEEIYMYSDTPDDAIYDDFDAFFFQNHPLGNNILGNKQSILSFEQSHVINFVHKNLNPEKIIISSVGNYTFEKLKKNVLKYVDSIPLSPSKKNALTYSNPTIFNLEKTKPILQAHFLMGFPSISCYDDRRIPLIFLVNLLSGPHMNSKLNLLMREKHGLVYSVEGQINTYTDIGQITLYFASEHKQLRKGQNLIYKEIKKIQDKPISHIELYKAKQRLKGQIAMNEENNNAQMLNMATKLLYYNKISSLTDLFIKIDEISAHTLQNLAIEFFDLSQSSTLTYIPKNIS